MEAKTWLKGEGLIFATLAGSHLYGTETPESDVDIRGVCLAPPCVLLGLQGFEQFQPKGETAIAYSKSQDFPVSDDVTIYSLNKFFALCLNANPNILELLFTPGWTELYADGYWQDIVKNRHLFLSTKIVHTFAGYAYSQLSRIQRHYKWLKTPPEKPDPYEYGLNDTVEGAHHWESATMKSAYQNQLKNFQSYKTWRENRNPKRAALEAMYGYDTKHAMHLYRLIIEATELLKDGTLTLPLQPDTRAFLKQVQEGAIPYEEVVRMGKEAKDFLQSLEADSPLPRGPDFVGAEKLLIELNEEWLGVGI